MIKKNKPPTIRIIHLNEQEINKRSWLRLFFYDFETGIARQHTFRRVINLFLNELSRRIVKRTFVWGYPTAVNIESSAICNFKCSFCASGGSFGHRKGGILPYQNYCNIMDELAPYIYKVSLYNLGEPLLNKDIFRMITYAKMKKVLVCISTNGQLMGADTCRQLIESGCDHIIVSIDAATKEIHNELRPGGDFNVVIDNIRTLVKMRNDFRNQRPKITAQMVVMRKNEHQIEEFKKLGENLGVDVCCFSSFWAQDLGDSEEEKKTFELIPAHGQFTGYRKREAKVPGTCPWAWNRSIIGWDGNIIPCCFDYNATIKLGNVKKESFKSVWNGQKYRMLRRSIKTGKNQATVCRRCPIPCG